MEDVFGTVVILVSLLSAVLSLFLFRRAGRLYEAIQRAGEPWIDDGEQETRRTIIREEIRQELAQPRTADG
jgi:hypothetical protein